MSSSTTATTCTRPGSPVTTSSWCTGRPRPWPSWTAPGSTWSCGSGARRWPPSCRRIQGGEPSTARGIGRSTGASRGRTRQEERVGRPLLLGDDPAGLLDLAGDLAELVVGVVAEGGEGEDADHGDERQQQGVLHHGGAP